jgi:hypothetical protein
MPNHIPRESAVRGRREPPRDGGLMLRSQIELRRRLLLATAAICAASALLCSCTTAVPEKHVASTGEAANASQPPTGQPSPSPLARPGLLSVANPDVAFERAPYLKVRVGKLGRSALLVVALETTYSPDMPAEELVPPDGFRDISGSYAVARVGPAGGEYRFDLDPKHLHAPLENPSSDHKFVGWHVSVLLVDALRLESVIAPKSPNSRSESPAYLTAGQLTGSGPVVPDTETGKRRSDAWCLLKDPEYFAVPGLKGDFGADDGFVWTIFPIAELIDEVQFDHQ